MSAVAHDVSNEARDAHGRWIKGFAEMKSVVDGLLASGKITKSQHQALMQASSRHASMGRGIPEAAQHNPAKMLDYIAGTMRQDVKDANKKAPGGTEAKVLGRTARAVENVAAAAHGTTREGRHAPITHPPVHPDDIGATLGGVKVVKKASEATGAASKAKTDTGVAGITVKKLTADMMIANYVKMHGHEPSKDEIAKIEKKYGPVTASKEPSGSLRDQQKGVKLPEHAHKALRNYVTGAADGTAGKSWADRTISKRLRSATPLTESQQKYADSLDAAFHGVPATEKELTLHRGINTTKKSGVSQLPADLKVGDTFGDRGYMSTSTSSKVAEDFATATGDTLHLTLPAGAHPIDVNAHISGAYGAEREVLLPRGAQIRVTSIKDRVTKVQGPNGIEERHGRTIHGELILPDAPKDLPSDTNHEVHTDEPHEADGLPSESAPAAKSEPAVVEPLTKPLDKAGLRALRAEWTAKFRKMEAGQSIDTLNGGKVTYEGNDVWALHNDKGTVIKRHVYATRVARDMLAKNGIGVGSHVGEPAHSPANVKPSKPDVKTPEPRTPKPALKVVRSAKAAAQGALDKLKGPKVVKKMQTVKVSADQLRPGDIVTDGRIKFATLEKPFLSSYSQTGGQTIPHQRTVISVEKAEPGSSGKDRLLIKLGPPLNVPAGVDQLYIAKKYGSGVPNEPIERTASPTSVSTVKREVSVTKATGSKITLDKAPTTREFKAALDQAMQDATSPDAIAHLDPSHRPMPKGHKAGHAQQLLYDLAVGHLNGITRSKTVKTDDEYRAELNVGSNLRDVPDEQIEKHMEQVAALQGTGGGADQHFRDAWAEMKAGYAGESLTSIANKMFDQAQKANGIEYGDHQYHVSSDNANLMRQDFQKQQDKYIVDSAKVPDDIAEQHMQNAIAKLPDDEQASHREMWKTMRDNGSASESVDDAAQRFTSSMINSLVKSEYDRQNEQFVATNNLRSKGALDVAREDADRQTPHVFEVKRRNVSAPGAVSNGTEEPVWKGVFSGGLPVGGDSTTGRRLTDRPSDDLHALPSTVSDQELVRHIAASHASMATHRADWHAEHPDATFSEYANSPEFASNAMANELTSSIRPDSAKKTRNLVAKKRADNAEREMIDERRGLEGTVKYDSGLPTWTEDGKLEPQTFDAIDARQKGVALPGVQLQERHYDTLMEVSQENIPGLTSTQTSGINNEAHGGTGDTTSANYHAAISKAMTPEGAQQMGIGEPITEEQAVALRSVMDEIEQSWAASHPDQAVRDYVPTFHTQGLVEDGVLYHRQEDASLDPTKLKQALTQGVRQAAKKVEGQTEDHPLTAGELHDALHTPEILALGSGAKAQAGQFSHETQVARTRQVLDAVAPHGSSPEFSNLSTGGIEGVTSRINSYRSHTDYYGLSNEELDKIQAAADVAFMKAEGRTRQRQLPQVNLDEIVRAATQEDGGLDRARQWISDNDGHIPNSVPVLSSEQADELTKSLDIVEKSLANKTVGTTSGSAPQEADNEMIKALENAGAVIVTNTKWQKTTGTWFKTTPGDMLLLQEGTESRPLTEDEKAAHIKQSLPQLQKGNLGYKGFDAEAGQAINDMNDANQRYKDAGSMGGLTDAQQAHSAAVEHFAQRMEAMAEEKSPLYKQKYLQKAKSVRTKYGTEGKLKRATVAADKAQHVTAPEGGTTRRIEYVPWRQGGKDSLNGPGYRSMKGTLRMEGYTPEEATAKLKELGIVGDLESHTPAQAIFRSGRRTGDVSPLHSAYVRGEAPPPDMPVLLTHGLTDSNVSDSVNAFQNISNSGGLMSISDRFKRNIPTSTSSKAGDIGSGIDHVVFCAMNSGSTCGSGSPIRIALRPDTVMRRDVAISPLDFGGGTDRYGKYKAFRDSMEAETGKEVSGTSLYTPLDPAARQLQLDKYEKGRTQGFGTIEDSHSWNGGAEFDIAHQIRVEDMQAIACRDQPTADKIQKHLDMLLKAGHVSRIPKVILSSEWEKTVILK